MFNNPIIRRYQYSQFRPQQFWTFGTLYTALVLLILFINTSLFHATNQFDSKQELYQALFIQFAVLQLLIAWIILPFNGSNVIPREIADRSYDFFRMLPLPAWQKTTGIIIGRNLFGWVIALINLVFFTYFAYAADITINLILQFLLTITCVTMVFNCAGLLLSQMTTKKGKPTSNIALVIVVFVFFGPFIGGMSEMLESDKLENARIWFGNNQIPALILVSGYTLITAIWMFIGNGRRFNREFEPLFSRPGEYIFSICYLIQVFLVMYHYLYDGYEDREESIQIYYFVTVLPMLFIPFLSVRSVDTYLEITRLHPPGKGLLSKVFLHSNFYSSLCLFVLWGISAGIVTLTGNYAIDDFWLILILLLPSYVVFIGLVELFTIYIIKNEKIGFLLVFLGALYLFLPLILAALFESEELLRFSPIGRFFKLEKMYQPDQIIPVLLVDLVFLIPILILIFRNYSAIAEIRGLLESIAQKKANQSNSTV